MDQTPSENGVATQAALSLEPGPTMVSANIGMMDQTSPESSVATQASLYFQSGLTMISGNIGTVDQTPSESSSATQAALPTVSDLLPDSESQWKLASMSPKAPKARSRSKDAVQTHIRAEDAELKEIVSVTCLPSTRSKSADKGAAQTPTEAENSELEEIDADIWPSSHAGSGVQTPRKRQRSSSLSKSGVNLEGGDVQPKAESPDLKFPAEKPSPRKHRKSTFGNRIPILRRKSSRSSSPDLPTVQEVLNPPKSSRTPSPDDQDSGNGETEYEYDLEDTDFSDIDEEDDNKPFVALDPAPSQKKCREKSVKTPQEWWARSYRKKAKLQPRRNRKTFGKDGADAKISNFLSYDPIAAHKEESDKEKSPGIEASSKKVFFDQMLRNIRTDGRIHNCRGDKTALKVAGESFGRANVKYRNENKWAVTGMKTALFNHQLLCASWMLSREFDPAGPFGGLNCDVMGLGKTLEMLAIIVANPRPKGAENRGIGPTLIVAPLSICPQWVAEIAKHLANANLNVILYSKSQKLTLNTLIKCDLVVTSYEQIRMSCPYPPVSWLKALKKKLKEDSTSDERLCIEKWIKDNRKAYGGVLHQIYWRRTVLDEAIQESILQAQG
ncbi:hypothetical protein DSL72_004656 [Monilinia vaccinii-corymbosi]|uniref:Helicase ATP-binding domain-containing protein n=1 Tax=Monilinia vaccinii-corymbosi TaxID=61207 RepID=A0A8A3P4C3_9HELO|nr:hypothetical protein DSL72_004656 [Monilinia vaccinii-corymbosi]